MPADFVQCKGCRRYHGACDVQHHPATKLIIFPKTHITHFFGASCDSNAVANPVTTVVLWQKLPILTARTVSSPAHEVIHDRGS